MYITVHTAAATMKMPETNIMSKSPLRSWITSGKGSEGSDQKTSMTTPIKVKASRSITSGRRSSRPVMSGATIEIPRSTDTMATRMVSRSVSALPNDNMPSPPAIIRPPNTSAGIRHRKARTRS